MGGGGGGKMGVADLGRGTGAVVDGATVLVAVGNMSVTDFHTGVK